jgi:hypothetical protein
MAGRRPSASKSVRARVSAADRDVRAPINDWRRNAGIRGLWKIMCHAEAWEA